MHPTYACRRFRLGASVVALLLALGGSLEAQVVFADDFEAGYDAWSLTGHFQPIAATDACGSLVPPFPTGGQNGVRAGNPSFCGLFSAEADLELLDPISVPDTPLDVKLRFWSYDETECLSCRWDWRFVYAQVVGTSTWDFVGESASWFEWVETELDLNAYRGQDIVLRFHFDPVDGFGNDGIGWVIDEIRVELETPEPFVYCTPKLSSDGCLATIGVSGGTAGFEATTPFLVTASNVSEFKNGFFFYGLGASAFPYEGGWFCVNPPTARTPVQSSGSNGGPCSGTFELDFNAHIQSVQPFFLSAGDHVFGQYWLRDPGDPFGSVRTDAVGFVLLD